MFLLRLLPIAFPLLLLSAPPLLTENFSHGYPRDAVVRMIVLPGLDHHMRAAIDLACIKNSSWPEQTIDVPGTCLSPADRSPPK